MKRRLFAALFFLAAQPGAADTLILPHEYVDEEHRNEFKVCRAAILVELAVPEADRTSLPRPIVQAMREQVQFIMTETVFGVPVINMEDGKKRMEFTERFIIDFASMVGAQKLNIDEKAERMPILLSCQPRLWTIMKHQIDVLMQWRAKAMGLDRPFPYDSGPHPEHR